MSFAPYTGPVTSVLRSSDDEILRDLIAVVDAVADKPARLTKSGLPPKPLWTAINDRLLWQDPRSILDDWDEVDQIRFVYSLAMRLHAIAPGYDRVLDIGVGADRFFFASPTRRAAMLLRAWLEIEDWDERCDARNGQGHRYQFGQTFRRDFAMAAPDVRMGVIDALRGLEPGKWYVSDVLAALLTESMPTMLLAEDDAPADVPDDGINEEVARFVDYWLYQAARFGWVDLARVGDYNDPPRPPASKLDDDEEPRRVQPRAQEGDRVFATTPLLTRIIRAAFDDFIPEDEDAWKEKRPFIPDEDHHIALVRAEADIGDDYLLRRMADPAQLPSWDDEEPTYVLTEASLQRAYQRMLNQQVLQERFFARLRAPLDPATATLLDDTLVAPADNLLSLGMTAVEFASETCEEAEAARDAGFDVFGAVAVVPWDRWEDYVRQFGEPEEGFEYPTEEPLASVKKSSIELVWPVLPMAGRDLLERLSLQGSPLSAPLTEGIVGTLEPQWSLKATAEALRVLTVGDLPGWLSKHLDQDPDA